MFGKKKKKPEIISKNYLLKVPVHPSSLEWSSDDSGMVTLYKENKGAMNFIAQKLFKKPRISQIHLDKNGSFAWLSSDGERDIIAIGELVKAEFGAEAEPLRYSKATALSNGKKTEIKKRTR